MPGSISPNLPSKGEPLGSSDGRIRGSLITLRDGLNAILGSGNKVSRDGLEADAKPVAWYQPKIINTEETRESATFGPLSTPDEITGVNVPEGGIMRVGYVALWKSSVSVAGRAAVTLNTAGITTVMSPSVEESTVSTSFHLLSTTAIGPSGGRVLLTGRGEVPEVPAIGMTFIDIVRLNAGIYNVAIHFRATSGSVTAKERRLWVEVHGT